MRGNVEVLQGSAISKAGCSQLVFSPRVLVVEPSQQGVDYRAPLFLAMHLFWMRPHRGHHLIVWGHQLRVGANWTRPWGRFQNRIVPTTSVLDLWLCKSGGEKSSMNISPLVAGHFLLLETGCFAKWKTKGNHRQACGTYTSRYYVSNCL